MKPRPRSIWVLLVCLSPPAIWFGTFNAIYGAQTLACLLPEPPHWIFIYSVGAAAGLFLVGFFAVLFLSRTRVDDTRPVGVFDLALLSAIGAGLIGAAAIALPLC